MINYSSQANIDKRNAVKAWALQNGWGLSPRSPDVIRADGTERHRLQIGFGVLREQIWTARNYTHGVKGYWKTVCSTPWGSVRLVDSELIRDTNVCRGFGIKIKVKGE